MPRHTHQMHFCTHDKLADNSYLKLKPKTKMAHRFITLLLTLVAYSQCESHGKYNYLIAAVHMLIVIQEYKTNTAYLSCLVSKIKD